MKNEAGIRSRRLAIEVLIKVDKEGAFVNSALANALEGSELSGRDKAFVTALVMGVVRNQKQLDCRVASLSTKPLNKLPKLLLNILRLGLFQMQEMTEIPESAVLDTCCKLARLLGHQGWVSFTNAILRSHLRTREDAKPQDMDKGTALLSERFSLPEWLIRRWISNFGEEDTITILKQTGAPPPLILRVNDMAITAEGFQNILLSSDIKTKRGLLVPSCLYIDQEERLHKPATELPGFDDGLFSVQDEASSFVVKILDPQPGENILDLCAAPGGKTTFISELMNNEGQVFAIDKDSKRLDVLKANRRRLSLSNIRTIVADAVASEELPHSMDRVLLDAPCMGTGVLNRHADKRFRTKPSDIESLVSLQRKLLEKAARLLKDDGILVYSTCSIEPEENIQQVNWFLEAHPNFQSESLLSYLPDIALQDWRTRDVNNLWCDDTILAAQNGHIQLVPSRHSGSGFFIARLRKLALREGEQPSS